MGVKSYDDTCVEGCGDVEIMKWARGGSFGVHE